MENGADLGPAGGQPTPPASPQVNCWACGVLVQVPVVNGQPSPIFKCGWCGAISEAAPHASKHTSNAFVRCLKAPGSGLLRLLSRLRILVVAFVTLLIASIIVLGVGFVLTRMCESEASWYAHSIITWALSFSTFFNFFAAVSLSPGTVLECVRIPKRSGRELIPQHSFENFKYCWPCKAPKAPGAHHCSVCNKCIMDMDHHCPFINNCVGRANLRNFFLFLVWAEAAVLYCIAMAGGLLYKERDILLEGFRLALTNCAKRGEYLFLVPHMVFVTPLHLMAALYIVAASIGVAAGVGALLWSQLHHILSGTSYISSLKQGKQPEPQTRQQTRLQHEHAGHACSDPACKEAPGEAATDAPPGSDSEEEAFCFSHAGAAAAGAGDASQPQDGSASASTSMQKRSGKDGSGTKRQQQQAGGTASGSSSRWSHLQRVMGGSSLLLWVLPTWGPPDGVLVDPPQEAATGPGNGRSDGALQQGQGGAADSGAVLSSAAGNDAAEAKKRE